MSILCGAGVIVTGGTGFLGQHLLKEVEKQTGGVYYTPPRDELDLTDRKTTLDWFQHAHEHVGVDVVFHLAGYNGGIQFNRDNPADIFSRNTAMALNVLEACKEIGVKKVVSVVASCAYPEMEWCNSAPDGYEPRYEPIPRVIMRENEFLDGEPHNSVACHAYAKRNLQLASKFYHDQYGLNAVCVCPTTMFGPGDSVDPDRTKVLMAVVKKVVDAHRDGTELKFMGTGSAMREFIFVKDAARLIVEASEKWNQNDIPLNLGTGHELSIGALVNRVVEIVGYKGNISWDMDPEKDGQLRKRLDLRLMKQVLGTPKLTNFQKALQETVEWYDGLVKP